MSLIQTIAPTVEPIDYDEVLTHLRLDDPTNSEQAEIERLIRSARSYVEETTGLQLLQATYKWNLARFTGEPLFVPKPPLISVTSIKYIDGTGTQQTISSGDYTVDEESSPGRIVPDYNVVWPPTQGHVQDVEIIFKAGYGTDPLDVPDPIRQAMLLIVGHLYDNRGGCEGELPRAADLLLMPFTKSYARRTDGEVLYNQAAW